MSIRSARASPEDRSVRPASRQALHVLRPHGHLYVSLTPQYENHSHTITAFINVPKEGGNGVLLADGAKSGGFSLFLKDGKPTYTYNYFEYFERKITTITSPDPFLPAQQPSASTLPKMVEASAKVQLPCCASTIDPSPKPESNEPFRWPSLSRTPST
jgi:hypothetical protein